MKKTLTIRVGDKQLLTIREIANVEQRSVSAVIRIMIDEAIKKNYAGTVEESFKL